ncbi:hypothetical protein [Ascidiaceihabitans sp.]|uniref:hypothetical protein n=1 Tax=Ascidiaceihabitans sp. TaxID=1872644 RepID=UPI0032996044
MIAPDLSKLKQMSEIELIKAYDQHAANTQIGTGFLLDEIRYREAERLNRQVVHLTRVITILTVVMTIATIINVVVFLNDSPTVPGFLE